MHQETRDKIKDQILDKYLNGDGAVEICDLVQGWLISGEDSDIKDQKLKQRFFAMVRANRTPGNRTFESLYKIHELLGFPKAKHLFLLFKYNVAFRVAAVILPFIILSGAMQIYFSENYKTTAMLVANEVPVVVKAQDERREITLTDGSRVWLGENSEMEYPENFKENRVIKLKGEAYFAVAKHEGKTFEVKADELNIRVLGTEFFVKTDSGDGKTEVTLASGKVEAVNTRNDIVYELSPQEQLLLDNRTMQVERNVVAEDYSESYKTIEPTPPLLSLNEVFTKIADAHTVKFAIADGVATDTKIRIKINVDNIMPLEELLGVIQMVAEPSFNFKVDGETVWITKK